MRASSLISLCLAAVFAGCQSAPLAPHESAPDREALSLQERGVWRDSEDLDQRLEKSAAVYSDAEATTYVQRVMDRLYPEFSGRIRVKILRAPTLNAFALPNGSIYIHMGMLARLENEAQLATVLAHEGVHFTHRHSLKQHENVKLTAGVLQVVAMTVPIAGLLGATVARSALYGYSRDLEREADTVGYERLARAGYDTSEAPKTFEHLAAEVKALQIEEPFFFATHPRLIERIESFKQLNSGKVVTGLRAAEPYNAAMRNVKLAALESDISRRRYESVLLALEDEARRRQYPIEALYYLGEAYRQRSIAGDEGRAERAYLTAVENAPLYAPPYRALGIHRMKQKDFPAARSYFKRYLELAPHALDRAYIEKYYVHVSQEAP